MSRAYQLRAYIVAAFGLLSYETYDGVSFEALHPSFRPNSQRRQQQQRHHWIVLFV